MKDSPWTELQRIQNFLELPVELSKESFKWSEERGLYCLDKSGAANCAGKGKGRSHGWEFESYLQDKLARFFKPFGKLWNFIDVSAHLICLDSHFADLVKRRFSWQLNENADV